MKFHTVIKNNLSAHLVFRKRFGKDTWHWNRSCSNYPMDNFEEFRSEHEPEGDMCNECRNIELGPQTAVRPSTGGFKKPLKYYLF